jgi:hypothetical protein
MEPVWKTTGSPRNLAQQAGEIPDLRIVQLREGRTGKPMAEPVEAAAGPARRAFGPCAVLRVEAAGALPVLTHHGTFPRWFSPPGTYLPFLNWMIDRHII